MPEIITTDEITFSDPQTVAVEDLRAGDFVVAWPTQMGIRGARVNSAIKTISEAPAGRGWVQPMGRGRRSLPIRSMRVTFCSVDGSFTLPAGNAITTFNVIIRRPVSN